MKKLLVISLILIVGCAGNSNKEPVNQIKKVSTLILGNWKYIMSQKEGTKYYVMDLEYPPHYKIDFFECNESCNEEIKSTKVLEMRDGNIFENIKSENFTLEGELIDTFFPVGRFINDSTMVAVTNFGLKKKQEYYINGICEDSLILTNNRIYRINGEKINSMKHVYIREKR